MNFYFNQKRKNFYCIQHSNFFRVFDALCPTESSKARKRLCVILFCRDTPDQDLLRDSMRDFVLTNSFSKERVRFTYVFLERQPEFINAVAKVDFYKTYKETVECRRNVMLSSMTCCSIKRRNKKSRKKKISETSKCRPAQICMNL